MIQWVFADWKKYTDKIENWLAEMSAREETPRTRRGDADATCVGRSSWVWATTRAVGERGSG